MATKEEVLEGLRTSKAEPCLLGDAETAVDAAIAYLEGPPADAEQLLGRVGNRLSFIAQELRKVQDETERAREALLRLQREHAEATKAANPEPAVDVDLLGALKASLESR